MIALHRESYETLRFLCGATPRRESERDPDLNEWYQDDGVVLQFRLRRDGFASIQAKPVDESNVPMVDGVPFYTAEFQTPEVTFPTTCGRVFLNVAAPNDSPLVVTWKGRDGSVCRSEEVIGVESTR